MTATTAYLARHDVDAHVRRPCPSTRRKRDLMLATLRETFPPGVRWTEPDGGLFTWLTFPEGFDATAFLVEELLPLAKVAYVPGATFFPTEQEPNHARISSRACPTSGSCAA